MPIYCYKTDDGRVEDRFFHSTEDRPAHITLEDGSLAHYDFLETAGKKTHKVAGSGYPYWSDAMGVHPDQIPEQREYLERRGIDATYSPDGRLRVNNRSHFQQLRKAHNLVDRSGYG